MFVSTYDRHVDLPLAMTVVQDGPYFYFFRDEAHANAEGSEEGHPLMYVESTVEVEYCNEKQARTAREEVCGYFCQHNLDFI